MKRIDRCVAYNLLGSSQKYRAKSEDEAESRAEYASISVADSHGWM